MRSVYDRGLNAMLTVDAAERVRCILPLQPESSGERTPLAAAEAFVRRVAEAVRFGAAGRERMREPVSFLEPREQGPEYRLAVEKPLFDVTTIGFYQTLQNTPVWRSGLSATVKHGPHRVVGALDTSHDDVEARLPPAEAIERFRRLFETATPAEASAVLADLLNLDGGRAGPVGGDGETAAGPTLIRGRFFIYRHRADARTSAPHGEQDEEPGEAPQPRWAHGPTLPLPPLPGDIVEGRDYLVAEITFALPADGRARMNWRMMVEVESGAVLYLRALAAGVNGYVFLADPITASGDPTQGPTRSDADLAPWQDDVPLLNLDGTGMLRGTYAEVADVVLPAIPPPSVGSFPPRTDEFAAVNAYYHTDRFFRLVEDLGFSVPAYFSHTWNNNHFPLVVDHRSGLGGPANSVDALCVGDGNGGILRVEYGLAHPHTWQGPMGIACDWRIHLHELAGHGVLYEHVDSDSLGFAHSAGDSFAVILNDPESAWHSSPSPQIDRFWVAPFVPSSTRRCDRDPAVNGWGWGGSQDDSGGYKSHKRNSEEMLSTCMFRFYRSIGGDSSAIASRQFAARTSAFLLLGAIDTLTPATNPAKPELFCNALEKADKAHWTSEGIFGGAYGKVIRWSFELQGAFQDWASSAFGIGRGSPPPVDVYIEDGRAGEYPYPPLHWSTSHIWNRRQPDGGAAHQAPIIGATNYAYVRVRNRGTSQAQNVVVRGFHCEPSMGLLWPDDLQPMTTPQLSVGPMENFSWTQEEQVAGPFAWTPVVNAYGHDCLIMIVTADGDPSNADLFTGGPGGPTIPEWRLVPHDNNVGQRNVYPVPAAGPDDVATALDGAWFRVGNPIRASVTVTLVVNLPELLSGRGWRLEFEGEGPRFRLEPGERRRVVMKVTRGRPYTRAEVEATADRDILVTAHADGALIGGMTYRLDPEISRAAYAPRGDGGRGVGKGWARWAEMVRSLLARLRRMWRG